MSNTDTFKAVIDTIDNYWDEAIELQKSLTSIIALAPENGGDGEKDKADFLRNWLQEELHPDDLSDCPVPDNRVACGYRPNIIARFNGSRDSHTIWIMTHIDVVPPGDETRWSGDPWTIRVEKDPAGRTKLIGRGVEDNQQGLVSSLLAVKALHDLDIMSEYDIGLIFTSDEETGSHCGIQYLLEHHRGIFRKNDLVIIPDAGNKKGTMIEIAEKSILWLKFQVLGKQTHGSEPEKGRNAYKAACFLITRLNTLYHKFRKRNAMFDPPISTFEPTKHETNVPNINTIPGEDIFYFDCRILPEYKISDVLQVIKMLIRESEKKFKVKINVTYPQKEQAAPPTSPEAPVVQALTKALRQLRRIRPQPMGIGGGTVASFFRSAGIPAAVWSTMDDTAHNPDEYCLVENILEDAKVFAHIFLQN